jgi:DNA repair protein RadC
MLILTESELKAIEKANKIMEKAALYQKQSMTNPLLVSQFLRSKIGFADVENFVVLYLDNQNALIECVIEAIGTIDRASVYPRNIAKGALIRNASTVILGHNHPSGITAPSQADFTITRRIQEALNLFNIKVLDHVIVAGGNSHSFAENGQI